MKVLPVLGIVGAVFASLAIGVLVPDSLAMFVPLLIGLAGSILLVGQRRVLGAILGIVVLAVTVVAALGLVGSVSTEDGGETRLGVSVATGQVLAILACIAIPLSAVVLRWDDAEPRWLVIAGAACGALGFLVAAVNADHIGDQSHTPILVAMPLALAAVAAMVPLLRAEEDAPVELPPLAAFEAPVAKAPAKPAASPPKAPASKPAAPRKKAP